MKVMQLLIVTLMFFVIGNAFASGGNQIDVTFVNNSPKLLKCGISNVTDYTPFIRLQPGDKKHFQGFKRGSSVRCLTEIDERSTTVLTYFSVNEEGEYELLQERVACSTCPTKVRWATIVTLPNGEALYNKLEGR